MVIRICGKVVPKPVYSATNILYLVFHSDDSVECSGFMIEYTANGRLFYNLFLIHTKLLNIVKHIYQM